jgi:hypothetical protein
MLNVARKRPWTCSRLWKVFLGRDNRPVMFKHPLAALVRDAENAEGD